MCGIVAVVSQAPIQESTLEASLEKLRHRGPDGSGIWVSSCRTVAIGHHRLEMTGGSSGGQPLVSSDGSVVAAVNGELYGYSKLRLELEQSGFQFQTDSDSELALALYRRDGESFVSQLRGEFAIVLWDAERRRLLAYRDRFGIKPLVYAQQRAKLVVASEAKAIRPWLEKSLAIDDEAMFFASSFQYLPPSMTMFAGVQQLPPAKCLEFENGNLSVRQYWALHASNLLQTNFDRPELVQRLRASFVEAVKDRFDSEAPLCFHLSGGVDSSSVLGIASQATSQPLHAFTISFDRDDYNEIETARRTASFCNAELHQVHVTYQQQLEHLMESAAASEGLAINGHGVAKFLLNRAIHHAGFKGALTGEGADEIFYGYDHLRSDYFNLNNLPVESGDLQRKNKTSMGMMMPAGEALSTAAFADRLGWVPAFLAAKATLGHRVRQLMNDDRLIQWRKDPAECWLDRIGVVPARGVQASAWLWVQLALAGYIFKTLGDGMEMASSVEGRVPFLDHHLVEQTREIPLDQMISPKRGKPLLRDIVEPYVLSELFSKHKHPLDAPPLLCSGRPEVTEFLLDVVSSETFRKQPFFDSEKVTNKLFQLASMSQAERQLWDPAFMMLVTFLGIQASIQEK